MVTKDIKEAILMSGLVVRFGIHEDIDDLIRVENECWGEEQSLTREHFETQLRIFPEAIYVAENGGKIAGVGVVEIIQYDLQRPIHSWYVATDDGFIEKTHNSNGNAFYGVSLSVRPGAPPKTGYKMLEAGKKELVKRGLSKFVIGSRLPRYHKYADTMLAEDYLKTKKGSRFLDPELQFYFSCGFEIVTLLPNYFIDPESLNYGVLMVWRPE